MFPQRPAADSDRVEVETVEARMTAISSRKGMPMSKQLRGRRCVVAWLVVAALLPVGAVAEDDELDNAIDPSGTWESPIGTLSLLQVADTLSFSYAAVFGPTAHLCHGAGVAGLVGRNRYEFEDEQGIVAFVVAEDRVEMHTVDGIASFCGAGWPGDVLPRDGFRSPADCTVAVEKAVFHVVDHVDPEPRRAYVIAGDRVDVVPAPHDPDGEWLLARFAGETLTTVGLLRGSDVRCRPDRFPEARATPSGHRACPSPRTGGD
jgi:hypothetical protein